MPEPRRLRPDDLDGLLELSTSAGWNQTAADWRRVLALEPAGCFGIEEEGRVTASATVVTYERELAWIGMVLTLPEFRGRGFATALMCRSIEYCGSRGVACVKLDATGMGRPVYARLGFVEEYAVERWAGALPEASRMPVEFDFALDRLAFGAGRGALLALTGSSRLGRIASYIGPVVARTTDEARERILHCGVHGPAFWDVPLANPAAVSLTGSLGFQPARRLIRMRRGRPIEEHPEYVFALAGFEYG